MGGAGRDAARYAPIMMCKGRPFSLAAPWLKSIICGAGVRSIGRGAP